MRTENTSAADAWARTLFGDIDLWQLLRDRARRGPDRPLLTWQPFDRASTTFTYGQIEQQASAAAAGLLRRGVEPGDRVLVHLENCPEFIIAWLACAAVGAIAVTTNTRSALDELTYYAADSGAIGAITQPNLVNLVSHAAPGLRWLVCTDNDAGAPADRTSKPGNAESFAALHGDPATLQAVPPQLMRALSVQYTSGTTSRPKGVVWTHANALWAGRVNATNEALRSDDCHFVYLPLFHANAMTFSLLPVLWSGARLVLTPKWSTSRFWQYAVEHRCTWVSLIGLSIRALMGMPCPTHHHLRMFGTGMCADEFPGLGVKTIGWWGMTETVGPGIVGDALGSNRLNAIGRAATQYQLAVVDDAGKPTPYDETGHLLIRGVRGVSLFDGYLGKPKVTQDSFDAQGWFRTGDLVTPHADGYFTFADRHKDMLRVGAENVAASEIERVIQSVPGVYEAAVVGRADDKLDEVPVAFVQAALSAGAGLEAAIRAACKSMLADFKQPREIHFVRALPRSTVAKISKVELRAAVGLQADLRGAEARWIEAEKHDPSGDVG